MHQTKRRPIFLLNSLPRMDQDCERGIAVTTAQSSEPIFTLAVTPPTSGSTPAPPPYIFDEESRYNDRLAPGPRPRPRRNRVLMKSRRLGSSRGHLCLQVSLLMVIIASITFAVSMVVYCDLKELMYGREEVVKVHHMQGLVRVRMSGIRLPESIAHAPLTMSALPTDETTNLTARLTDSHFPTCTTYTKTRTRTTHFHAQDGRPLQSEQTQQPRSDTAPSASSPLHSFTALSRIRRSISTRSFTLTQGLLSQPTP